jgi:hypothetical protein
MAGHADRMGEMTNTKNIAFDKSKGNVPLGRHMDRWKDNIKNRS